MNFKILLTSLFVSVLAISAFAENKFVIGPSYKAVVHADNTVDHAFGQAYGFSFETESPFFAVPDETYLLYNYTRSEIPGTNLSAGFHDAQIRGLWYFNDSTSTSRFNPFLVAGVAYQTETAPEGLSANEEFGGDFGLGFGYDLTARTFLWGASTVRVASEVVVNAGLGLGFSL